MKTFTANQKVSAHSIGGRHCIFTGTVVKRTEKTVTIKTQLEGLSRVKIHIDPTDGNEFAFPFGPYSKSPIFRA